MDEEDLLDFGEDLMDLDGLEDGDDGDDGVSGAEEGTGAAAAAGAENTLDVVTTGPSPTAGLDKRVKEFISLSLQSNPASTTGAIGTGGDGASVSSETGTVSSEFEPNLLGSTYQRCKTARTTSMRVTSTDCTAGATLGSKILVSEKRIGSFDTAGDESLARTFRGSRVTANGKMVNQNLTASFDPANLVCTTCTIPHNIIPQDGSGMVLIIGDQNFVSAVTGKSHCTPVVRIEDGTLSELFRIGLEILDKNTLPLNTHFLVGSASHLSRIGTTLYCMEWQQMVRDFNNRWLHATVGPLTPILREQTAPGLCKQLAEVKHWYDTVYEGNFCYQSAAWNKLLNLLANTPDSGVDLGADDIYTVALPTSLTDTTLRPFKYHVSSCHAATAVFSGVATDELICTLLEQLHTSFSCDAHPGDYIARAPAGQEGAATPTTQGNKVLLIGGSHCKRLIPDFEHLGYTVVDRTVPGWQPTDANIAKLEADLVAMGDLRGVTVICDFISNVTYRYEQMDGQLLLPIKLGGRYHLLGKVTVATKEILVCILKKLNGVFSKLPGLKICISPLPRYLTNGCCEDMDHCTGTSDPEHGKNIIACVAKVRKVLREFVTSVHSNVFVPDFLSLMLPGCNTNAAVATALSDLTLQDGVHLTPLGYKKLAECIDRYVQNKIALANVVSGPGATGEKPFSFYWRGFVSPVGAARPDRRAAFHENKSGGGKMVTVRNSGAYRGGRSYPPGGRHWN